MRYIRLSYDVAANMPLYPGTKPVGIEKVKAIAQGDSCNTLFLSLSNHAGTHLDAPRHFWDTGKSLSDCAIDELIFKKPCMLDCRKGPGEVIGTQDLQTLKDRRDSDIVIIRTGFGRYRESDSGIYCEKNPCLAPDAARWLKETLPELRAVGIDCISVASPAHHDLGRETHRILLGNDSGRPLFIIEDLCLPENIDEFREVIVAPLFIENGDGAPCTVIGAMVD